MNSLLEESDPARVGVNVQGVTFQYVNSVALGKRHGSDGLDGISNSIVSGPVSPTSLVHTGRCGQLTLTTIKIKTAARK